MSHPSNHPLNAFMANLLVEFCPDPETWTVEIVSDNACRGHQSKQKASCRWMSDDSTNANTSPKKMNSPKKPCRRVSIGDEDDIAPQLLSLEFEEEEEEVEEQLHEDYGDGDDNDQMIETSLVSYQQVEPQQFCCLEGSQETFLACIEELTESEESEEDQKFYCIGKPKLLPQNNTASHCSSINEGQVIWLLSRI